MHTHRHWMPPKRQYGWRLSNALIIAGMMSLLGGCYDRKESAVINPDGSGKITIETDISVAAGVAGAAGGDRNAEVLTTGRLFAASMIKTTRGVDAWANVAVSQAADGRAHIVGTAYFPDLNKLKFDVPIEFTWKRDLEGAVFTIERTHSAAKAAATAPTADQVKALVKQSQDQHKLNQAMMQVQLGAFNQSMRFELPGELSDEHLMKREGNQVAFSIDGKKLFKAIDEIMANDAALSATFLGGVDGPANDDLMLQSMTGEKGPISVRAKFVPGAKPTFDYVTEMKAAQLLEAGMLKAAGVELLAKFTVREPRTAPAK